MAHEHGTMDIQQNKDTWAAFCRLLVWAGGLTVLVLLLLLIFVVN